tara:strand:+ start:412 stop:678 length:267 start_codon:yes stop_codon:yes gene_type:complete
MPNRLRGLQEYELVQTLKDDLTSSNVLRTIVEEGETPVNTWRLNLGPTNPLTMIDFQNSEEVENFCLQCPDNFWSPYFEDPEPEEGGE